MTTSEAPTRWRAAPSTWPETTSSWPAKPDEKSGSTISNTPTSTTRYLPILDPIPFLEEAWMSDERSAAISSAAAHSAREPRTLRLISALLALVALAAAVLFALWLGEHQRTSALTGQVTGLHGDLASVQAQQQDAAAKSRALYDQVASLGKVPVVSAAAPIVGPAGRGIVGTVLADGHLIVTYSDGQTSDVGQVAGSVGPSGVSMTSTLLVGGHLIITYSDGKTADVGLVVGPAGAMGPVGPKGDPSPAGQITQRYADGTTSTCIRDAHAPGPDSAPNYTCPPPTAPPTGG